MHAYHWVHLKRVCIAGSPHLSVAGSVMVNILSHSRIYHNQDVINPPHCSTSWYIITSLLLHCGKGLSLCFGQCWILGHWKLVTQSKLVGTEWSPKGPPTDFKLLETGPGRQILTITWFGLDVSCLCANKFGAHFLQIIRLFFWILRYVNHAWFAWWILSSFL